MSLKILSAIFVGGLVGAICIFQGQDAGLVLALSFGGPASFLVYEFLNRREQDAEYRRRQSRYE